MSFKDRFNRNKDIKKQSTWSEICKITSLQVNGFDCSCSWIILQVWSAFQFLKQQFYWIRSSSFVTRKVCALQTKKSLLIFQVQLLCCHAFSIRCPTSLDWTRTDSLYNLSWLWLDKCFDWIQKTMRYNLSEVHAIKKGLLVWRSRKEKYIFDVSKCVAKQYTLKTFHPIKYRKDCRTFFHIWRTFF